ncbi:hypothetical protein LDB17_04315 [Dysgonomonas sp. Shenzhen-Wh21]|uniref:DUF6712 family protein n=1 Tax=Dysgonomonas TaxID=156973 RepID=UPI00208FD9D3|nr:DUF6712 family protein [Dysgonomonas mossii]
MLIPDLATFVKYIPTIGEYNPDPNRTDWDNLLSFVQEAELLLKTNLLGADLMGLITASADTEIKTAACTVIACNAYYAAIPFVDLIQTPNGFAVVSNTNQAPASKERVDRLLKWLEARISESTDMLISLIFKDQTYNTAWKSFGLYDYYTECLYMTADSFRRYCKKDALRYHLEELHPVLMSYQNKMGNMISHEYMDDLLQKRRTNSLTVEDIAMIRALMSVMGMLYREDNDTAYKLLETTVNTMVENIEKYPVYAASQAYRIKTDSKYKNEKNQPTFFF